MSGGRVPSPAYHILPVQSQAGYAGRHRGWLAILILYRETMEELSEDKASLIPFLPL